MNSFQLRMLAASCLLWACVGAQADESAASIGLLTPIGYADGANTKSPLQEDCDIGAIVAEDFSIMMKKGGAGGTPVASADSGRVLRVQIARANGADGGLWRPKTLAVDLELLAGGRVLAKTHLTSESMSPNPFKGACSSLHRVTVKLGRAAVRWIRDTESGSPGTPVARDAGEPRDPDQAASGAAR
jgi:hypothetical protein